MGGDDIGSTTAVVGLRRKVSPAKAGDEVFPWVDLSPG
jgi:hypothetical protein